jgi:predicted 3-demethylubiquinone-9 3-methyltransferase (glyoxalase superfamily)
MPKATPFLWFNGKIEAAVKFYKGVFGKDCKVASLGPMGATLKILGQELILFNGGPHFKLNPAFSLMIHCKTQKEVDFYWKKLTKGGEESRCGWLADPYGVSWQVIPDVLTKLMWDKDRVRAQRVTEAMLKMNKIVIADLKKAYAGR